MLMRGIGGGLKMRTVSSGNSSVPPVESTSLHPSFFIVLFLVIDYNDSKIL